MTSTAATQALPGVAYIKPEYVLVTENVAPTEGSKAATPDAADGSRSSASGAGKRPAEEQLQQEGNNKRRGQNKQRPRLIKTPRCKKLCRSIGAMTKEDYQEALEKQKAEASSVKTSVATSDSGKKADVTAEYEALIKGMINPVGKGHPLCPFASCEYLHDTASYMATKSEDIGPTCYNYDTFGFCDYGIRCRFGSSHIENGYNVRNDELWNKMKDRKTSAVILPKDIQTQIRKRSYDFSRTDSAVKKALAEQAKKLPAVRLVDEINSVDNSSVDAVAAASDNSSVNATSTAGNGTKFSTAVAEDGSTETTAAAKNGSINSAATTKNGSEETTVTAHDGSMDTAASTDNSATDSAANGAQDVTNGSVKNTKLGPAIDTDLVRLRPEEKKKIVWRDQLYLAPLTTLGNLPFRRICKRFGADITCGEMALSRSILQGSPNEWALVKKHHTESVFGVQLCGSNAEMMARASQLLDHLAEIDFVDINVGCPIDFIYKQGAGSGLMRRTNALELMVRGMTKVLPCPVTVKMRTSIYNGEQIAHKILPQCAKWGADMVTLHGRSREQRYTKFADWQYIKECVAHTTPLPLFGNGDVLNYEDYIARKAEAGVAGIMIGRGALMKPWIFTEIKEQRHWDISSSERFDILKEFVNNGLEHWGSDEEGVEKTRRFLLEWLSFLHRYIPLGLLERPPQGINQKPPLYIGRDHLETLMASKNSTDWIKISELLLGPVSDSFQFLPKHKANSWG